MVHRKKNKKNCFVESKLPVKNQGVFLSVTKLKEVKVMKDEC